ncbi:MAG: DUF3298 and DUF4163 domain-containing protein [Syntrophomonadaceae bacterium]|jgi:hypothetical protein
MRKVSSITILLLLIVFAVTCLGCNGNSSASLQELPVTISTEETKDSKDNLELTLKLPSLKDLKDQTLQQSLNYRFRAPFKQRQPEMLAEREEMKKEAAQNNFELHPYALASDYKVTYNNHGLLSLYIDQYEYTGGAHGITYRTPYNTDLKTGSDIKLADVFKPGSNYKDAINKAIKAEIAKNPENYFEPEMGFQGIKEDQSFTLQPGGITIYFQLYDIAPYAFGIPEFKIPFKQLGDMVNPDLQKRLD